MSAFSIFKNIMAAGWHGVLAWEIEKTEESLHREFKAKDGANPNMTDKDWGKISKAIAAFANAEGGVLIFGVHAKSSGPNMPDQVQKVIPIADALRIKGNIQRRLSELVTPPVPGVRVEHITQPDSPDAGIVVIYVPASGVESHRTMAGEAGDRQHYHMRTDVNTTLMSHSLLAERFGRRPLSKLYLVAEYSLNRNHCTVDMWICNRGRGYAERPAVSFVQYPNRENPDRTDDILWHMIKPAKGWDNVIRTAGCKDGTGTVIRATAETVLYPGMELPLGFLEASPRPSGRSSFRLSVHGTLYALNSPPAQFGLVQDLAIEGDDMARTVGRIEVLVIDPQESE